MNIFKESKVVRPKNFLAHYETLSKLPDGAVLRPKIGVSYGPFADREVSEHLLSYKGSTFDCKKTVYRNGRREYQILVPHDYEQ